MHNKAGISGGLSLETLSSYCDTNPVASSWLGFYDDCEGEVSLIPPGTAVSYTGACSAVLTRVDRIAVAPKN